MTLLPIVERELRVAARRRSTFWWRTSVVLAALLILGWLMLIGGENFFTPQRSGRNLFAVLIGVCFTVCLVIGGAFTADCLSSEKREGTLGLLFLTDLRGYDVVLGKLAATSITAFVALLGLLPVLSLPVLLGGLNKLALTGMAILLINTLFFSLTAGLFASAISRDDRRAISTTLCIILGVTAGLPLLAAVIEEFSFLRARHDLANFLICFSPGFALTAGYERLVFNPAGATPLAGRFWVSQLLLALQSGLFLALACAILPRTWHERARDPGRALGWRSLWRQWSLGGASTRLALRRELLDLNPVTWLTNRYRSRVRAPWLLLGFAALVWFAGALHAREDWYNTFVAISTALVIHLAFKYQVAAEACRRFAEDRRVGTLEALLSTPFSTQEIVRGQWLALFRIFGPPLMALVLANILLLFTGLKDAGSGWSEFTATMLAGVLIAVLDSITLAQFGSWNGLNSRSYGGALAWTLFVVLFVPWIVFLVTSITAGAFGVLDSLHGGSSAVFSLVLWWSFISVLTDLICLARARTGLNQRFREIACDSGKARAKR